jgi:octaprenyl-diphosphate synthase
MPAHVRLNMDSLLTMQGLENTPWREISPFRQIDSSLRQVSGLIHKVLMGHGPEPQLGCLFDHLEVCPGQMLRPGMVLLAGECFGSLRDEHVQVAALMEMIHRATLLHDGVMEDGRKRRGVPTASCLWGNESAVLLGDFVLSQVFRMAADLDSTAAKILAQTAVRVCEGELRQAIQERNWKLDEAQYIEIITEKSASLFSGCCRLGAVLSHAGEDQIESLARFGLLAGVAFEITDDLLDIAGDENRMGKTPQSDFAKDKPTLAVIHLLRTVDAPHRADVCAIVESSGGPRGELVDMLDRYGSLQYARAQAADYATKAITALESLPSGKGRDALIETAHFMANRMA